MDGNDLFPPCNTSCSIDDNLFQVNSRSYSPSTINQNSSPINCSIQSTPIKTMDLYPGSTKLSTIDEPKPVVNTIPNFTFINPKALMSSTKNNRVD